MKRKSKTTTRYGCKGGGRVAREGAVDADILPLMICIKFRRGPDERPGRRRRRQREERQEVSLFARPIFRPPIVPTATVISVIAGIHGFFIALLQLCAAVDFYSESSR